MNNRHPLRRPSLTLRNAAMKFRKSPLHQEHGIYPRRNAMPWTCTACCRTRWRASKKEVERRIANVRALPSNLDRYVFLRDLQDTNETLYFALITTYLEELLPIIYTPTVGAGCQQFSSIYRRPRGLFLSLPLKGRQPTGRSSPTRASTTSRHRRLMASGSGPGRPGRRRHGDSHRQAGDLLGLRGHRPVYNPADHAGRRASPAPSAWVTRRLCGLALPVYAGEEDDDGRGLRSPP